MAQSRYLTHLFSSEQFVESVGAVLFKPSTGQVCLLYKHNSKEWLLAKGRRGIGETRHVAAIREVQEETGFTCYLPRVSMLSRCTPTVEQGYTRDVPRLYEGVCEPFMVTHRHLGGGNNIKIIWWYIGVINEQVEPVAAEEGYTAHSFDVDDALDTLTYAADREVVEKAVSILYATVASQHGFAQLASAVSPPQPS